MKLPNNFAKKNPNLYNKIDTGVIASKCIGCHTGEYGSVCTICTLDGDGW